MNVNIDYRTHSLIVPFNKGFTENDSGEPTADVIKIYVPPCSAAEIENNAILLGSYTDLYDDKKSHLILMKDYKAYLNMICEQNKLGEKHLARLNDMLDRALAGAFVYIDGKPQLLSSSIYKDNVDLKEWLKATLLFFTGIFRYYGWGAYKVIAEGYLKSLNVTTTSLPPTEYKNI